MKKRIKRVTIEKGWYFTVGSTYGWTAEHSLEGVGLNKQLFVDSDVIHVTVKGKNGGKMRYELDTEKGREFINRYNSYEMIGSTKVGYVPRTLLKAL